jgi:putative effector of murein hydrolase
MSKHISLQEFAILLLNGSAARTKKWAKLEDAFEHVLVPVPVTVPVTVPVGRFLGGMYGVFPAAAAALLLTFGTALWC